MKQTYTVNEVCALMEMSRRSVIRIFEREPGVIELTRPEEMHKRRYRLLRIPRAVLERVILRMSRDGQIAVRF